MALKAIAFDIGFTLVDYPHPLNWKSAYLPALQAAGRQCGRTLSDGDLQAAADILTLYNTRENPREAEVGCSRIFGEILRAWGAPRSLLPAVKKGFFGFFQQDAACFEEAGPVLESLRLLGLRLGALTDVAYGMDRGLALRDIGPIRKDLEVVLTSVDVGFRKPHPAGYEQLLRAFDIQPQEMLFVGDEQKDILGAGRAGVVSALINRSGQGVDHGQMYTLRDLRQLPDLAKQLM